MKKIIVSMVAAAIVLSLVACSSGGNEVSTNSGEATSSAPVSSESPELPSSSESDPLSDDLLSPDSDAPDVASDSPVGIKGSHITDIRVSLNNAVGIPEGSIERASDDEKDLYAYFSGSSYTDPDLDVSFDYSLTCDEDFQVIKAVFSIFNGAVLSPQDFQNLAAQYLSYCATMPCDTVDTELSGNHVKFSIQNLLEDQNGMEIIWGDASYIVDWKTNDSGELINASLTISQTDGSSKKPEDTVHLNLD